MTTEPKPARGARISHVSLDIRDALAGPRARLDFLQEEGGRRLTPDEAFAYLSGLVVDGFDRMPLCECDNFHPKHGCQGHPAPAERAPMVDANPFQMAPPRPASASTDRDPLPDDEPQAPDPSPEQAA